MLVFFFGSLAATLAVVVGSFVVTLGSYELLVQRSGCSGFCLE